MRKDKSATRIYNREYLRRLRLEHPERVAAYEAKRDPERRRDINRRADEKRKRNMTDEQREARRESQRKSTARWRAKNPERASEVERTSKLRATLRDHGLTMQWYTEKLTEQSGVCAMCREAPQPRKRLSIDHCHATGKVRGLLCDACNLVLGYARDVSATLRAGAEYLDKHSAAGVV